CKYSASIRSCPGNRLPFGGLPRRSGSGMWCWTGNSMRSGLTEIQKTSSRAEPMVLSDLPRILVSFLVLPVMFGCLASAASPTQPVRVRVAAEHIFFHAFRVIDPGEGTILDDAGIEVSGGRILRVAPWKHLGAAADGRVVDWSSQYVIPGLIDT